MKRYTALVSIAGSILATLVVAGASVAQTDSKTVDFSGASWTEVPDTSKSGQEAAKIDIKGLQRNGDLVVYDVWIPGGQYGRTEGNCTTKQARSLRMGGFETLTEAYYTEMDYPLEEASEFQKPLLEFACQASAES